MKSKLLSLMAVGILLTACNKKEPIISDWDSYIQEHESRKLSRLERLKTENGWLNLAGLLWLEQGENTFGSDPSNSIVFPEKFAAFGGTIILDDSITRLVSHADTRILVNGEPAKELNLRSDLQKDKTIMEYEDFRWFIIKRGDNYGIRLRDLNHPRLQLLDHIPSYPFNKDWVIEATLVPFDSIKTIEVPTVLPGFSEFYKAPGQLEFTIKGKKQSLIPFKSGKGYFLIVGDASNGMETYGAGRFMYSDQIEGDKVILDFNRATNPPCAFSPFATCPLPPLENILKISIEAGEKAVHLD